MKILVFGGAGLVGSRFYELNSSKFEIDAPDISEVDILDQKQLGECFKKSHPDAVINFAAYTNVKEAEKQKGDKNGSCYKINVEGAANVAKICQESGAHLIHISTDYVFDGAKSERPYTEEDTPNPINWYGQTKHLAEQAVLKSGANITMMRISMPYSAHYELKTDVARFFLRHFQSNEPISAIEDQRITPTLVDDIANALKVIAEKKSKGIYHVSVTNDTSPYEFAKLLAKTFSLDQSLIEPISLDGYNKGKLAPLLRYSWLDPSKFISEFGEGILHSVEEEVKLFRSAYLI